MTQATWRFDESLRYLEATVHRNWQRRAFSMSAFHEVAAEALRDIDMSQWMTLEKVLGWATSTRLVTQSPGENDYGEPTVTLSRNDVFRIELIFWPYATGAIHDHSSPGAFIALSGRRLHSMFSFIGEETLADGVELGQLRCRYTELLKPGDIRCIEGLAGGIHSLFFCDLPCVSLSIRAQHRVGQPRIYEAPRLSISRNRVDRYAIDVRRRLQLLRYLCRLRSTLTRETVIRGSNGEFGATYVLLTELVRVGIQLDYVLGVAEQLRPQIGSLVDVLLPILCEWSRRRKLIRVIERNVEPDVLFALGLIWIGADRETTRILTEERFPNLEPAEAIEAALHRAHGTDGSGIDRLVATLSRASAETAKQT